MYPKSLIMLLYRFVDYFIVLFCWAAAYFIRFHIMAGFGSSVSVEILLMGFLVGILSYFFFSHNDLYTSQRYFSWHHEMFSVFKSHFQAISTFILLLYFFNPSRLSRYMLIIYALMVVILSLSGRLFIKSVLSRRRRQGRNLRHVILIGSNRSILEYARRVMTTPELGLRVTGWLDSKGKAADMDIPHLDSMAHIPIKREEGAPDALIVGYSAHEYPKQGNFLAHFNRTVIPVWILPDIENTFIGYAIESFHGLPMLKINASRLSIVETLIKRFMDIVGSIIALILLSPLFLVIALLVKKSSRGPVFYGQERISIDGYAFTMWKFRSMKIDAESESGAVWTQKNDARTTTIGSFLRKTSFDEIPQFWNVLKGDMSLVGPRPERPVFIEKFRNEIPSYMLRHKMKSGITGWAQVNGWRGDTSLEKRIEFDLYYIQNWSIWFDFKIFYLTILKGFINPNAY